MFHGGDISRAANTLLGRKPSAEQARENFEKLTRLGTTLLALGSDDVKLVSGQLSLSRRCAQGLDDFIEAFGLATDVGTLRHPKLDEIANVMKRFRGNPTDRCAVTIVAECRNFARLREAGSFKAPAVDVVAKLFLAIRARWFGTAVKSVEACQLDVAVQGRVSEALLVTTDKGLVLALPPPQKPRKAWCVSDTQGKSWRLRLRLDSYLKRDIDLAAFGVLNRPLMPRALAEQFALFRGIIKGQQDVEVPQNREHLRASLCRDLLAQFGMEASCVYFPKVGSGHWAYREIQITEEDFTTPFDSRHFQQGALGNCYFVAGLRALSDIFDLSAIVRPVSVDGATDGRVVESLNDGAVAVRLFRADHGDGAEAEWIHVGPTLLRDGSGCLLYMDIKKGTNPLPALVEKAFAKAAGSFTETEGGYAADALFRLTGVQGESSRLSALLPFRSVSDLPGWTCRWSQMNAHGLTVAQLSERLGCTAAELVAANPCLVPIARSDRPIDHAVLIRVSCSAPVAGRTLRQLAASHDISIEALRSGRLNGLLENVGDDEVPSLEIVSVPRPLELPLSCTHAPKSLLPRPAPFDALEDPSSWYRYVKAHAFRCERRFIQALDEGTLFGDDVEAYVDAWVAGSDKDKKTLKAYYRQYEHVHSDGSCGEALLEVCDEIGRRLGQGDLTFLSTKKWEHAVEGQALCAGLLGNAGENYGPVAGLCAQHVYQVIGVKVLRADKAVLPSRVPLENRRYEPVLILRNPHGQNGSRYNPKSQRFSLAPSSEVAVVPLRMLPALFSKLTYWSPRSGVALPFKKPKAPKEP
jgi:hypothetical protein